MGHDYVTCIVSNINELAALQEPSNVERRVFLRHTNGPGHSVDMVRLSERNILHTHYNNGTIYIWFRRVDMGYNSNMADYIWMYGTLSEFEVLRTYLKSNSSSVPTFDSDTLVVFGNHIVCILPGNNCAGEYPDGIVHLLYTTISVSLSESILQNTQHYILVYVKDAEATVEAMLFAKSIRILDVVGETIYIHRVLKVGNVQLTVDLSHTDVCDMLTSISFRADPTGYTSGEPKSRTKLLSAKNINMPNTTEDGFFALYINYTDISSVRERCSDRYLFAYDDGVIIDYERHLHTFDNKRCVLDLISRPIGQQESYNPQDGA